MARNILIVDCDKKIRKVLKKVFEAQGFCCESAGCAKEALKKIKEKAYDVAIFDLGLPDMPGIELFKASTEIRPTLSVIFSTEHATLNSTIEALRLGAYDYMVKPLNLEAVVSKVKRLMQHKECVEDAQLLRLELDRKFDFSNIVARSRPMRKVCDLIRRVSNTDSNVLIIGNSGTGKELVARAIHFNSHRKTQQFVPVNCSAIPETLFESELFGHKKGAFTGAIKDKDGLFKVAAKGTLFLDEISCMSFSVQAKLLRAIEFKQITPVGSTEPISVNARIIAATNRELTEEIEAGRFREDLYYRLNVIEIRLPSLEARKEDIPSLVQHFVRKFAKEMAKPVTGVDSEVMKILMNYRWKGEVRELENVIERAMIFCENSVITVNDLPPNICGGCGHKFAIDYSKPLKEAVKDFERHFILTKLQHKHGHRSKTLKALGMSESSFYRKLEELGIKTPVTSVRKTNKFEKVA
jgi:DNA-binding NtrC family response regulator